MGSGKEALAELCQSSLPPFSFFSWPWRKMSTTLDAQRRRKRRLGSGFSSAGRKRPTRKPIIAGVLRLVRWSVGRRSPACLEEAKGPPWLFNSGGSRQNNFCPLVGNVQNCSFGFGRKRCSQHFCLDCETETQRWWWKG